MSLNNTNHPNPNTILVFIDEVLCATINIHRHQHHHLAPQPFKTCICRCDNHLVIGVGREVGAGKGDCMAGLIDLDMYLVASLSKANMLFCCRKEFMMMP